MNGFDVLFTLDLELILGHFAALIVFHKRHKIRGNIHISSIVVVFPSLQKLLDRFRANGSLVARGLCKVYEFLQFTDIRADLQLSHKRFHRIGIQQYRKEHLGIKTLDDRVAVRSGSIAIVFHSRRLVVQRGIRFKQFQEFSLRRFVVGILVGMQNLGFATIGLFDLRRRGAGSDAQNIVQIVELGRSSGRCPSLFQFFLFARQIVVDPFATILVPQLALPGGLPRAGRRS
mmetsp:Transcript_11315/g.31241  ORF Transcript_11315/g.31241 Transcript_11315/m.31241 type:complete len:231 (-) Transcript_11315:455-1147(-)